MITAIYVKDNTQLTILTHEDLFLEKMGSNERTLLTSGLDNVVSVGRGVFRVQSKKAAVTVTASTQVIHVVATPYDKDGGPIDQPKGMVGPSLPVAEAARTAEAARMAEAANAMMPPPGFMSELDVAAVRKFLFPAKGAIVP